MVSTPTLMIYDSLAAHGRYRRLGPRFAAAFDFLLTPRTAWEPGRIEIIPDEVWALTVRKDGGKPEAAKFEYHRQFADLHHCIAGSDRFGWRERFDDLEPVAPFSEEKDFGLMKGIPTQFLPLYGDRFAVLFPGELHAGHIGDGEITRVCIKIRIDHET